MKQGATHVVTITTEYKDGLECVEFFRGSEGECRDLAARFGDCAYDERRTGYRNESIRRPRQRLGRLSR
jgi:hypothetical protein